MHCIQIGQDLKLTVFLSVSYSLMQPTHTQCSDIKNPIFIHFIEKLSG